MPELPEVEAFRHLLLGLVIGGEDPHKKDDDSDSSSCFLQIETAGESSRIRLNSIDRAEIAQHYMCTNILRKGKQLCLVLTCRNTNSCHMNNNKEHPSRTKTKYLFCTWA